MMGEVKEHFKAEIGCMRILACFLVIISHLVSMVVFNPEYVQSRAAALLYIMRDSCVPLFLIITGIVAFRKEVSLKKCLRKAGEMLWLYIVFSVLFYIIDHDVRIAFSLKDLQIIWNSLLAPKGHLWYLPLIVQIYCLMPVLKNLVMDQKSMACFLGFWLVVSFVFPLVLNVLSLCGNDILYVQAVNKLLSHFTVPALILYSGYVLLGYYLYYYSGNIRTCNALLILIVTVLISFLYGEFYLAATGRTCNYCFVYNSLPALIESAAITMVAKNLSGAAFGNSRFVRFIKEVSGTTFGIYLVHPALTEKSLKYWNKSNILLGIPICALLIFILCALGVFVFRFLLAKGRILFTQKRPV